jgi:hypothetical protein
MKIIFEYEVVSVYELKCATAQHNSDTQNHSPTRKCTKVPKSPAYGDTIKRSYTRADRRALGRRGRRHVIGPSHARILAAAVAAWTTVGGHAVTFLLPLLDQGGSQRVA